ncbi:MAG: hypothetical protein V4496_02575 [Pseudomonadota bacterium]
MGIADINAPKEFDADFFIKEIEEIPVDSGKLCLKSCYSCDLTHEKLVNITKSIIEQMLKPAVISMYSRLFHHATMYSEDISQFLSALKIIFIIYFFLH